LRQLASNHLPMNEIARPRDSRNQVHSHVPNHRRHQTTERRPRSSEENPQHHRAHKSSPSLIKVRESKNDGGQQYNDSHRQTRTTKHRHGKSAIQKLLTQSGGHRKSEKGNQLPRTLRKYALRQGLQRPSYRHSRPPHASQVEPLKSDNQRGAKHGHNQERDAPRHRQAKLRERKSVGPRPPRSNDCGNPLKRDGRAV